MRIGEEERGGGGGREKEIKDVWESLGGIEIVWKEIVCVQDWRYFDTQ